MLQVPLEGKSRQVSNVLLSADPANACYQKMMSSFVKRVCSFLPEEVN